jgi:hypothetical protein
MGDGEKTHTLGLGRGGRRVRHGVGVGTAVDLSTVMAAVKLPVAYSTSSRSVWGI